MDVPAQALHSGFEDLSVVEGEGREGVDREPGRLVGIVASDYLVWLHKSIPCYGYHALARVTVHVGEDAELADGSRDQGGFFAKLPKSTLFGGLVHPQESSREGPFSLIGFTAAADKKDLQLPVLVSEDDTVGSDRHVSILVLIGELGPLHVSVRLAHRPNNLLDANIVCFGRETKNNVSKRHKRGGKYGGCRLSMTPAGEEPVRGSRRTLHRI